MAGPQAQNIVNGVDVEALKQTLGEMRKNPDLGQFRFRASNKWTDKSHNETRIEGFYGAGEEHRHASAFVCRNDEPGLLGGDDQEPNPVEWLLHALAGCVTTTMVFHAASRGIEIESVESELEGDIDVRGFLGLAPDVPKGYQNIRITLRVKSDAPSEKLAELARFSPVFNTLTHQTPVEVNVEKV